MTTEQADVACLRRPPKSEEGEGQEEGVVIMTSNGDLPASASLSQSATSITASASVSASANTRTTTRLLCVGFALLFVALVSNSNYNRLIDLYRHPNGYVQPKIDDIISLPLKPRVVRLDGIDHYYMLPDSSGQQKARGVLIFLHSCRRSGLEFFHLPEDRIIAYDALQHGLAILAPTSQHRESGCWTQPDMAWVGGIVDQWTQRYHLEDVPRIGMAVSSAASFLFFIYKSLRLQSMAVYNTPQSYDKAELGLAIPTIFATMPNDESIAHAMELNYERLREADVPTQLYKITPHPFTTDVCQARIPEMGKAKCNKLFSMIRTKKEFARLLDAEGYVKEDLKVGKWKQLFEKLELDKRNDDDEEDDEGGNDLYFSDFAHTGHSWLWAAVEQEVTACLAYHSMTAEHHSSILAFLMDQAGISKKYKPAK